MRDRVEAEGVTILFACSLVHSAPVAILSVLSGLLSWLLLLPHTAVWELRIHEASLTFAEIHTILSGLRVWVLLLQVVHFLWKLFVLIDEGRAYMVVTRTYISSSELVAAVLVAGCLLRHRLLSILPTKHKMEYQRVIDHDTFPGRMTTSNAFEDRVHLLPTRSYNFKMWMIYIPLIELLCLSLLMTSTQKAIGNMVTLFCALVGVKGNPFPVKIDASDLVGDLKKKIKEENEKTITCDARELQLFLAKKGDAWLTQKQVDEGISDTSDFKPLKVVAAPLQLVGLSEKDVAFELTMEDIETMNTPVHVLVVIPTEEDTVSPLAAIATTLFQHTFLYVSSTTATRTQKLKKQLVRDYKCDCGKNQNGDSMLLCMVMNIGLPSPVVIASHIFRREHDRLKGDFVQIEDIDDVRNGLLLFKPIESAFDDLDIAFLVDKQDQFILKIFNPMIKTQLLVDSLTQHQWDVLGGGSVPAHWRTSTSPIYASNAPQFNVLTTFGELDGKALRFPSGSTLRPFRRCLYHQAQLARAKAIIKGWVSKDYDFDDFSSEGFTLEEKMKLLFTSSLNIAGNPL